MSQQVCRGDGFKFVLTANLIFEQFLHIENEEWKCECHYQCHESEQGFLRLHRFAGGIRLIYQLALRLSGSHFQRIFLALLEQEDVEFVLNGLVAVEVACFALCGGELTHIALAFALQIFRSVDFDAHSAQGIVHATQHILTHGVELLVELHQSGVVGFCRGLEVLALGDERVV